MSIDTVVSESGKSAYKHFHFSQAVKSGGLLLCSGQIGTNPDHSVPESAGRSAKRALAGMDGYRYQRISRTGRTDGDPRYCTTPLGEI